MKTFTIATAPTAARNDLGNGHSVPVLMQRRWSGQASDATVSAWLASKGLTNARVSVHGAFQGGKIVDRVSERTVTA